MTFYSRTDAPEPDYIDSLPADARLALMRWQRSISALRLYRRRGWNDSAVAFAAKRDRESFHRALNRIQFAHDNPTLF